jgi:hypothetical protein
MMIRNIKKDLIKYADNINLDKVDTMLNYITDKDDYSAPHVLLKGENSPLYQLKQHLIDYRKSIIQLLASNPIHNLKDSTLIPESLSTADKIIDGQTQSWEEYTFKYLPMAADILTLTALQNNVRNTELNMLVYFYGRIERNSRHYEDSLRKAGIPIIRF